MAVNDVRVMERLFFGDGGSQRRDNSFFIRHLSRDWLCRNNSHLLVAPASPVSLLYHLPTTVCLAVPGIHRQLKRNGTRGRRQCPGTFTKRSLQCPADS